MKQTENKETEDIEEEKRANNNSSLSNNFNGKEDPIFSIYFWIRLTVGISLTLVIFLIVFFVVNEAKILNTINSSFANVCLMLTFAFFSYFFSKGYFDGIAYGMSYASSFITRAFRGSYGDYVEKRRAKREMGEETRFPFLPYLIIALVWLLVLIPSYIVFKV